MIILLRYLPDLSGHPTNVTRFGTITSLLQFFMRLGNFFFQQTDKESTASSRTDIVCHCDLVSGKCPKNFEVSGSNLMIRHIKVNCSINTFQRTNLES